MELFESVMWKYIREEQEILSSNIERTDIEELAETVKNFNHVVFVSHGSSFNSSETVSFFYNKYAHMNVTCVTSGNFIATENMVSLLDPKDTFVITISQTGNSRGTLLSAQLAKKYHLTTVGISTDKNAVLVDYVDYLLPLNCGEEDSNAKTKGMSSTILVLLLLGAAIGKKKKILSSQLQEEIKQELREQCLELKEVFNKSVEFCRINDFGKGVSNFYITGSGMNYGLALEAQIKLMETMCIPTCAVDTEEFSHGTHRSINKNTHLLILKTQENKVLAQKTFDYFEPKTNVYMIETFEENSNEKVVQVKQHPHTQSVLTIVEFIQIISAYGPENNRLDPNRESNNEFTEIVETRI